MPAPLENTNARKKLKDKSTTWIQVRVKKSDKARWKRAARALGYRAFAPFAIVALNEKAAARTVLPVRNRPLHAV